MKIELTMNGAVLIPNTAQYNAIQRAVGKIMLNENPEAASTSVNPKVTRERWTKEQEDYALQLLQHGYKLADIADKLNRRYGVHRTQLAIQIQLGKRKKKAGKVLDRVAESNGVEIPGFSTKPVVDSREVTEGDGIV